MKGIVKLLFGLVLMLPIFVFASDITFNKQTVYVNPGSTDTLIIDATNFAGRIDFSTNNSSIATVDSSSIWVDNESITVTLTGVNSGSTILNIALNVASYQEEVIQETRTVEVIVRNKATFKVDNQNYISYFAPGDRVVFKTDVTKTGYELEGYTYNNRLYKLNEQLTMPTSDITLIASWKVVVPTISPSTGYVVDNNYIRNITPLKKANTLNLMLDSVYTVKVVDKNNTVKTTAYIATGDKVQIFLDSTKLSEYIVIIEGDVNGDGEISPLDYVKIKNHIMETTMVTGDAYLDAADYNNDSEISPLDYVKVKNYIMNS